MSDRCEFMQYNPVAFKWPHVRRCAGTVAETVRVDGEDMALCAPHAGEAKSHEGKRVAHLEQNSTTTAVLCIEKALTARDRRIILERAPSNLQGAAVADLLDLYVDADMHLEWTEPFWESNPGVMPSAPLPAAIMRYSVQACAELDRDVPKLGDVLALVQRALAETGT